jgi:hypothetical protein
VIPADLGCTHFCFASDRTRRQFNEADLKQLPAGSFYTEPPNVDHFALTRGEGAVIAISGTGPSGTTYVDPRNDPSKK